MTHLTMEELEALYEEMEANYGEALDAQYKGGAQR